MIGKIHILALVALLIFASGCVTGNQPQGSSQGNVGASPATGKPKQYLVEISGYAFNPAAVQVKAGDSVKWVNNDSVPHTVTGTGIDSGSLSKGQSFTKQFNQTGNFDYACSIHPAMKGTIKAG